MEWDAIKAVLFFVGITLLGLVMLFAIGTAYYAAFTYEDPCGKESTSCEYYKCEARNAHNGVWWQTNYEERYQSCLLEQKIKQ